jgi:hypothetical protein
MEFAAAPCADFCTVPTTCQPTQGVVVGIVELDPMPHIDLSAQT